jgi:acyl transferase domain-containing protein
MARLARFAQSRPSSHLHLMSIACIFPGQGSQSAGMGRDLFDRFPEWTAEAGDVLG